MLQQQHSEAESATKRRVQIVANISATQAGNEEAANSRLLFSEASQGQVPTQDEVGI